MSQQVENRNKMVRAYQHRCMAIGLPYDLNGLLTDQKFLLTSIEYIHWRSLLHSNHFRDHKPTAGDSLANIVSLTDLQASGVRLQKLMMSLKQTVDGEDDSVYAGVHRCFNAFLVSH